MKRSWISLFFLLPLVPLLGQELIFEKTGGATQRISLSTLGSIRFAELDTLSNAALSIHTVTGIRHFRLSEIDSLDMKDNTDLLIYRAGSAGRIRRADIDKMAISPVTLPDRSADARNGSQFMQDILDMNFSQREPLILQEFLGGNIPDFSREFITCSSDFKDADGITHRVEYDVMSDYLSIGSNEDYCRVPMGPKSAQEIADAYGCILSTRKLCDDIWKHATVRLSPIPYAPVGDNNSQVYKFVEHNTDINAARADAGGGIFALIAGIKKDVVICNAIISKPNNVAIYGWHYPDGNPIQPLYTGHVDYYVDYSHGIRLINAIVRVDGVPLNAHDILQDPLLYKLLSDESGAMQQTRYLY
ncbi:MAG: hypothetical protein WC372_05925 [Candidatus Neomarinimicrobiota bacterium]|jgi:hypothetical protein|nr:hypothetical protein [Candidatus Neomarinimicrobiota bacterium]MDD3966159.1 hypothetical protein [Candidatus Neomarinimicrobiota bacterium]MDX9779735.1 hypothetical protein [bacterium]